MLFAFIGTTEVLIILAIALLVFGPAKLPEIGRQIAMAMREMRKMSNDVQRAFDLDDYRYDKRYEPSTYQTNETSTWTPDSYADPVAASATGAARTDASGTETDEMRGEPVPGTRPWSVQDDYEPEADWEQPVEAESEAKALASQSSARITPAASIEPPGPPGRREEL